MNKKTRKKGGLGAMKPEKARQIQSAGGKALWAKIRKMEKDAGKEIQGS